MILKKQCCSSVKFGLGADPRHTSNRSVQNHTVKQKEQTNDHHIQTVRYLKENHTVTILEIQTLR